MPILSDTDPQVHRYTDSPTYQVRDRRGDVPPSTRLRSVLHGSLNDPLTPLPRTVKPHPLAAPKVRR
jgi:hypothetical protein